MVYLGDLVFALYDAKNISKSWLSLPCLERAPFSARKRAEKLETRRKLRKEIKELSLMMADVSAELERAREVGWQSNNLEPHPAALRYGYLCNEQGRRYYLLDMLERELKHGPKLCLPCRMLKQSGVCPKKTGCWAWRYWYFCCVLAKKPLEERDRIGVSAVEVF